MNQKFINFGISADLRFWSMYGANFDRCFHGNTLPAAELRWDLAAELSVYDRAAGNTRKGDGEMWLRWRSEEKNHWIP